MKLSRPRPVLTANGVAGGVKAVVGILTFLGYNDASAHLDAMTATIVAVSIGAITLGGDILAALHAQSKVTPVAQPQDHDGTPLVRAGSIETVVDSGPLEVEPMPPVSTL